MWDKKEKVWKVLWAALQSNLSFLTFRIPHRHRHATVIETSMSFTVNFCRNWDGGEQERDTAVAAIKAVFPNASIEINRKNSYPIQVSIVNNSTDEVIWKGSQKNLFKKYNAKRTKAISEIKAGLEKLK